MPTPLGHALAGVAAGWIVSPPAADRRRVVVQIAVLGALAAAPDLDLLIGRHSMETHSIGAATLVASIAAWRRWPVAAGGRGRIWLAGWCAWLSHPLLDALSPDTAVPIGVMWLWPFSQEHMQTGLAVFAPIWRNPITTREIVHDLLAVLRELAILLPILTGLWFLRRR